MTQLIDLNRQLRQDWLSYPNKNYGRSKGLVSKGPNLYMSLKTRNGNHFSFIFSKKRSEYDLLFDVGFSNPYTIAKIYLLSKVGAILKIDSHLARVQLIRQFFFEKTLYQPNIDPLTGFVYFRINFFQLKKNNQFGQFGEIDSIFENFNVQKLYLSIKKLSVCQKSIQYDRWRVSTFQDQKNDFSISKAVALMTETKDFEQILTKKAFDFEPESQGQIQKLKSLQLNYFITGRKSFQVSPSFYRMRRQIKQIQNNHIYLSSLLKRKTGKSNYENLLVNAQTQKSLNEAMMMMLDANKLKQSFKLNEAQLGKITINLEKHDQKTFNQKVLLLQSLNKTIEYHFIDKYFKTSSNSHILLSLSLKNQTLSKFLQTNRTTLSLQTKMRILLQVYSAVNIMWQENKIILFVNNFSTVFITKNLGVKIRAIHHYFKPQSHIMFQDKQLINQKLAESILNLSQLYFKIFFRQGFMYLKPTSESFIESSLLEYCKKSLILQKLRFSKFLPEGINGYLKEFFTGLNYIFLDHIDRVRKIVNEKVSKKNQKQIFLVQNSDQKDKIKHQKQQQEKGYKQLSTKHVSCWLLKILEQLSQQGE